MAGGKAEYRPTVANPKLKQRLVRPFVAFAQGEANSGMLLVALAIVAMLWANFGPKGHYDAFWNQKVGLTLGDQKLVAHSIRHWINDGLMALFFLLMGLEIKREFLLGELSNFKKASLPIFAALGGMIVPAGIYAALNFNGGNMRGTGVPMATDIAFSLGVLALLGSRVPAALKIFLAAVAIVDDLGAVLVIAIFYTAKIDLTMLGAMFGCFAVLIAMNRLAVRSPLAYMAMGIPMWAFCWASGVHATVAGVLLALTIPVKTYLDPVMFEERAAKALQAFRDCRSEDPHLMTQDRQVALREMELAAEGIQMPLERMEDSLINWVSFFIVPLFALANAGVLLSGGSFLDSPVGLGVFLGLVLGKPIGVLLFSWIAIASKVATVPRGVTARHLVGVGILTGIGFTMSLFIGELAFGVDPAHDVAKLATLAASAVMGVAGFAVLYPKRIRHPKPKAS